MVVPFVEVNAASDFLASVDVLPAERSRQRGLAEQRAGSSDSGLAVKSCGLQTRESYLKRPLTDRAVQSIDTVSQVVRSGM